MKNYMKPAISFQALSMATSATDACNMSAKADPYQCPVDIPNWPGETVFTSNCTWSTNNPEEFDICYHGPSGIVSVFGS